MMKMVEVELTIAMALKELKSITAKIERYILDLSKYSSKMAASDDLIEGQAKFVKDRRKSVEDLLTRQLNIKMAIQKSNLENGFDHNGRTWTVSEAIFWKDKLKILYKGLWESFTDSTAENQIRRYRMDRSNLKEEDLVALNAIPILFYKEKEVMAKQDELIDLENQIDALIDASNHRTTITI